MPKRTPCSGCGRMPATCICSHLPSRPLAMPTTRVVVFQDVKEPVNMGTVEILRRTLENVTVHRGIAWDVATVRALVPEADDDVWLIWPGSGAQSISSMVLARGDAWRAAAPQRCCTGGGGDGMSCHSHARFDMSHVRVPRVLIAFDGTWRRASAMLAASEAAFAGYTRVKYDLEQYAAFGDFRREPRQHFLSTLEVVSKTVALLEHGDPDHRADEICFRPMLRSIELQRAFADE